MTIINLPPQIQVFDAIMGAGKTTRALSMIETATANHHFNHAPLERFIYITPLLSEVKRVQAACPLTDFREPQERKGDHDGMALTKGQHFEWMVNQGCNIVTTHSLFHWLSPSAIEALGRHGYQLVIDEALECFTIYTQLKPDEMEYLLDEAFIWVDPESGRIDWNEEKQAKGHRFEDIRRHSLNGSLYQIDEKIIVWAMPEKVLQQFKSITVLTYLFEGSMLYAYLRINGFPIRIVGTESEIDPEKGVEAGCLIPRDEVDEWRFKQAIREKLKVYQGPKNQIGNFRQKRGVRGSHKFTREHLTKRLKPDETKRIINAVTKYIERDTNIPTDKIGWTTLKEVQDDLKGPRYRDLECFIPMNMRASNDYKHKEAMIYLGNLFPQPPLMRWIKDKGETVDQEMFALSSMIQWLWRGCIRDGRPMHVFVPSKRMRDLLMAWIETDTLPELRKRIEALRPRKAATQKVKTLKAA